MTNQMPLWAKSGLVEKVNGRQEWKALFFGNGGDFFLSPDTGRWTSVDDWHDRLRNFQSEDHARAAIAGSPCPPGFASQPDQISVDRDLWRMLKEKIVSRRRELLAYEPQVAACYEAVLRWMKQLEENGKIE